jgi:hypothetical protein
MKILIDDYRNRLPDGSKPDAIFRSPFVFNILCGWERIHHDEIYLDHDMGDGERTGYDLITEFERGRHEYGWPLPDKIVCVSDNPMGRYRIQQVIDKLYGL